MLKGISILILWMILGFSTDYFIAKLNYVENTSMGVKALWLTVGIYISLLHCILIKTKNKTLTYRVLLPSSIVVFFISWSLLEFYIVEKNCAISESESLKAAINYVKMIKYQPQYLNQTPYKLGWCKLGFEYESPKHFNLVIVSEDGSVKLND